MYLNVSRMRAESGLVVSMLFGEEEKLGFIKNLLIPAEDLFPSIVALVIRGNGSLNGTVVFFGDDLGDLEVGMARF